MLSLLNMITSIKQSIQGEQGVTLPPNYGSIVEAGKERLMMATLILPEKFHSLTADDV